MSKAQNQIQQGRGFRDLNSRNEQMGAVGTVEEDPNNTSVFFWNLPHNITDEALYNLCAYYGHVRSVNIKYPKNSPEYSTQNVLAFVTMYTHNAAKTVINNLFGYSLNVHSFDFVHDRNSPYALDGEKAPQRIRYW